MYFVGQVLFIPAIKKLLELYLEETEDMMSSLEDLSRS